MESEQLMESMAEDGITQRNSDCDSEPKLRVDINVSTLADIFEYEEPKKLIDPILVKGTVSVLGAYTGIGKSIIALSIGRSVATGEPLWGIYPVEETGPVLIIDEETPNGFLRERIEKMGFDKALPVYFLHFQNVKVDEDKCFNALMEKIKEIRPVLVVIDSLIRVHRQREDDASSMSKVVDRLRKIANSGTTVLVIHHHRKGEGPLSQKLRGSSDIPGGVDIEYALVPKDGYLVFTTVKTRTKPLPPIQLMIEASDEKIEVLHLEHEMAEKEGILTEVVGILSEKGEAGVEEIQEALKQKRVDIGINKLRNILHEASLAGVLSEHIVARGKKIYGINPDSQFHDPIYTRGTVRVEDADPPELPLLTSRKTPLLPLLSSKESSKTLPSEPLNPMETNSASQLHNHTYPRETVKVESEEPTSFTDNPPILCDGDGVGGGNLASFSASQIEVSPSEGNAEALNAVEGRLSKENLRIVFKAKDLKKSVSRCVKFTNPKGFLSDYNYLCFSGNSIMATDGTVGIIHATPINFGEDKILVPADILYKAISSLKDQEIEMTIGKGVSIKSGSFKTKFQEINAWGYPPDGISFDIPVEGIKDTPKDFMASIKEVRFSVGRDRNHPEMKGVYFDGQYFYTTDDYRMTRLKSLETTEDAFLIPDFLLNKLVSEGEPSGFCIHQGAIWFFYNDIIAFGKLLETDREFPNCKTVFEQYDWMVRNKELRLVRFDRPVLKMALNNLAPLRPEPPSYRLDVVVRPRVLLLLVAGEEGEAIEKVECETDASGVFSVNLNFFKDAVNATECFYFSDQEKRAVYFSSQSGLETLLLPLELGDGESEATLERARRLLEEKE